jgi:hypothetical protein
MAVSMADCGVLHRVLRGASIVVVRLSVQLYQSGCSDSSQRGCNGLAAMAFAGGVWLRVVVMDRRACVASLHVM